MQALLTMNRLKASLLFIVLILCRGIIGIYVLIYTVGLIWYLNTINHPMLLLSVANVLIIVVLMISSIEFIDYATFGMEIRLAS